MKLAEIGERLGARLVGDGSVEISRINTIESAGTGELTFIANPRYVKFLETTQASAIIAKELPGSTGTNFLIHPDPYFAFSQALTLFFQSPGATLTKGIAKSAAIASSATIGQDTHIGNFVEVGENTHIGDNSKVMAGSIIGNNCKIGKNCMIYPNVTIYDGCTLGDNVAIHSSTVIGSDGFGYAFHGGVHNKVQQVGIVRIEANVEIGSNCSVDRAAIGETVIGEGTKIDNLVQIAHNVKIGRRCLIISQVGISGSVTLGEYVTLAGQVGVVGHLEIGDRVIVAAQSGVPKSLDRDKVYGGSPVREFSEYKRTLVHIHKLEERAEQIKRLETEVAALKILTEKLTAKLSDDAG
jgi:UDP-3-O-[3-hydroxymyristoyl] glucosamine N-acyltransferase